MKRLWQPQANKYNWAGTKCAGLFLSPPHYSVEKSRLAPNTRCVRSLVQDARMLQTPPFPWS
jgi:hypothetical protein